MTQAPALNGTPSVKAVDPLADALPVPLSPLQSRPGAATTALQGQQFRALVEAGPPATPEASPRSAAEVRQQHEWAAVQRHQQQQQQQPADATTSARERAAMAPSSASEQAAGEAAATVPALAAPSPSEAQQPAGAPVGNDLVGLLEQLCKQVYVTQDADPANARMLLDLGQTLPGSLVELARDGAFLRVRLHAADPAAGALMESQRERLEEALSRSTRLGVVVDVVRPR
jgi:hypothetical protein